MENIQKKIGIIGGGQLGKMMLLEAKKMGFTVVILDPSPKCPAHSLADEQIVAAFDDEKAIRLLSEKTDVVTYEFEHINAHILQALESQGKEIYPSAKSLLRIQNKLTQKQDLAERRIPVPDFCPIPDFTALQTAGEQYGMPFLLKTCTGGYDGKGNFVIHTVDELETGYETLGGGKIPLMAERFFPFVMEISVLACRGKNGEIQIYPVAENIHEDNILDETRVPAAISEETIKNAMTLAKEVMETFQGVGMFCIELFVDKEGAVVVNEVAPRPHNSGHYTIEACVTSQFEQHIRAITGLPLGSPRLLSPVVMKNILGESNTSGQTIVLGAEDALKMPGVSLHVYGKEESRPLRKMGHLTVLAETLEEAIENARVAKDCVKICGQEGLSSKS